MNIRLASCIAAALALGGCSTSPTQNTMAQSQSKPRTYTLVSEYMVEEQAPTFEDIHFTTGSARLTPEGQRSLDKAIKALADSPDVEVIVEGFTDERGSPGYNDNLSKRRAKAVADYLEQHGVASNRLAVAGFGKAFPIDAQHSKSAWAKNRRVHLESNNIRYTVYDVDTIPAQHRTMISDDFFE